MSWPRILLVTALCAGACGEPGGLELASIDPAVVSTRVATPALIRGSGLLGTVTVDLDDESDPSIDQSWRVRVGATDVGSAAPDGAGNLAITVPAGLPLGSHDVVVTGPGGAGDTLSNALSVIDGDPNADAGPGSDASASCDICAGGTCEGGCMIDCGLNGCPEQVVCPAGADCVIGCNGGDSCAGGVDCTAAASCVIECSGLESCRGPIVCGPGACAVHCSGNDSCTALDCTGSCGCEITCSGSTTCQPPAECPTGCQQGRGCTLLGSGCDTCP